MPKQELSVQVAIHSFVHGISGVEDRQKYALALQDELRSAADYADDYVIDLLCITGTHPMQYPVDALTDVIKTLKQHISFQKNAEITLQALPGSVTYADLRALSEQGVNRICFDMSSFVPSELDRLGRTYSPRAIEVFMRMVQLKFVFFNFEVVLHYGIPGQTVESFRYSIEQAIKFMATNLTLLPYKSDNEENFAFYQEAVETIGLHGFQQYTPCHFTRPGYASQWNRLVYSNRPRLGFGVDAVSKIDSMIIQNTADVQKYLVANCDPAEMIARLEPVPQNSLAANAVLDRLFSLEGIESTFLTAELREIISCLCEQRLLQMFDEERVRLTDIGKADWQTVASEIMR